jgi:hypothetical protein
VICVPGRTIAALAQDKNLMAPAERRLEEEDWKS